jgi:hypothetical protein
MLLRRDLNFCGVADLGPAEEEEEEEEEVDATGNERTSDDCVEAGILRQTLVWF